MLRTRFLPFLLLPLLAGCNATFTNLTPRQQERTTNNLYMVEFALNSRQQTLLWDTVKPRIKVGEEYYEMKRVRLMTNRWEGLLPAPPSANSVRYSYKAEFLYNSFGAPRTDTLLSPEYTLKIAAPSDGASK